MTNYTKNIAILGANSHIAKGLICNFLSHTQFELYLFTRDSISIRDFIHKNSICSDRCKIISEYLYFDRNEYDVVINCIGAGPPNKLKGKFSNWFTLTEKFDNMTIDYLQKHPQTLYVNFSSGAIYGQNAIMPAQHDTICKLYPNNFADADYYTIARLNSEAKHRSFKQLNIVDLRIFAYFSRFIDLDSGYFISALLKCAIEGTVFHTHQGNIVRDYIHPDDLFTLIKFCTEQNYINSAIDVISRAPVDKWQLLNFFKEKYNLEYIVDQKIKDFGPNGSRSVYCSKCTHAHKIGFNPKYNSLDAVAAETDELFKQRRINCD